MFDKLELTSKQWEAIEKHTLERYPEEMCGFLTETDFIPVSNIAENPKASFTISAEDRVKYLNSAIAIVHSHTKDPREPELFDLRTPSFSDFKNQQKTNLPWLIVGCESISVSSPLQFPRIPNNEYLGRRFQWFVNDCYSLVQDFYKFNLGIELPNAVVETDYKEIRSSEDLFEPYILEFGFVEILLEDIQEGDLIILDNRGIANNHLGIYTQGQILHQDLLSVQVPFETFLGRIKKVLHYAARD